MKKIFAFILCIALIVALPITCFADAEIDLSELSYEELVALKDKINLAMWECEEWEEVEVPQGVWQVGVDIPAGHWTLTAAEGVYSSISVGSKLDVSGKDVDRADYGRTMLVSPTFKSFDAKKHIESTDFNLLEGVYVVIDDGSVVFTPYEGKASLGFK